MAEDGQLARHAGRARRPEPSLAELLDPIALEERLKEARARRAEALARREAAEAALPASVEPPLTHVAAEPAAPRRARRLALPAGMFLAGIGLGAAVVVLVADPALRSRLLPAPDAAPARPAAAPGTATDASPPASTPAPEVTAAPAPPGTATAARPPAPGAATRLTRGPGPALLTAPQSDAPAAVPAAPAPAPDIVPSPNLPGAAVADRAPAPAAPAELARGPGPAELPRPGADTPAGLPVATAPAPDLAPSPEPPGAAVADRPPAPGAAAALVRGPEPAGLPAPASEPAPPAAPDTFLAVPQLRPAPRPAPVPPPVAPAAVALPAHVYLHYPPSAEAEADRAIALLQAAGIASVDAVPVRLDISRTNVRFFHAGDADAAASVAAILTPAVSGDPPQPRDFTDFPTPPASGKLEVWLAGDAPTVARAPRQPAAAPAPPAPAPDPAQAEAVARMLVQRAVERMLDERLGRR
jgi:hypothetical protein